jgi:hypothetical protein
LLPVQVELIGCHSSNLGKQIKSLEDNIPNQQTTQNESNPIQSVDRSCANTQQ